MILKTIKILPYVVASVSPSTFYTQPKKANETNTFNTTIRVENVANSTSPIENNDYYDYIYKYKQYGYKQTNELLVYETDYSYSYTQRNTYGDTTTYPYVWSSYVNENQATTATLKVLQMTPYKHLVNNEMQTAITIRYFTSPYDSSLETETIYADVYYSTEDYWNKYVNITMTDSYLPYNAIKDITNNELGFNYTKTTYSQNITETTNTSQNITFNDITFNVNPNKTNYYYIYIYTKYNPNGTDGTSTTKSSNSRIVISSYTNSTTLTGEYFTDLVTYEVIDVPNIMFEILSMPFTFISTAFNLTLFPNTPYQINISNLFLSVLGIFVFIFIMKLLLRIGTK